MRQRTRGFSMIELIAALAVAGVVAAGVTLWMARPLEALQDSHRRAAATDQAERIVGRLAKELPEALPNSLRVACAGRCLEFLPIVAAGRYRAAVPGDTLDLTSADDRFDVLKPLPATPQSGLQVVVNNQNALPGGTMSAYSADPNGNRGTVVGGSSSAQIRMSPKQFPAASLTQRFYLVDTPVSYLCDPAAGGGSLRHYRGYAIQATQPTDVGLGDVLAGGIVDCTFTLSDPDLVTLRLVAGDGTAEPLSFFSQFRVRHEP